MPSGACVLCQLPKAPSWQAAGFGGHRAPQNCLFLEGRKDVPLGRENGKRDLCWFNERTSWKRCREDQMFKVSTPHSPLKNPQKFLTKNFQIPSSLQNFSFSAD